MPLDFSEVSVADPAPRGITRMARIGGILRASTDGSAFQSLALGSVTEVSSPAGGSVDDAPAINAAMAIAAALGGGIVWLQRGTYRIKTRLDYPGNCVRLVGQGPGATVLMFDDSAGLTDGVRMLNRYLCSIEDLTISASAQRTAGVAISIQGGDSSILWNAVPAAFHQIVNVEMLKQCNGLEIIDGTGAVPNWGVGMDCRMNRWELANGGVGIRINTTGGLHYLSRVMITKVNGAGTPQLYQVQLTATKDCVLQTVSGTLGTDGCRIDPGVGQEITAVNIRDCRFDTITGAGLNIVPNAAASFCRQIDMINSWVANMSVGVNVQRDPARSIKVVGCQMYAAVGNPCMAIGGAAAVTGGVLFANNEVGGSNVGIIATNSSSDFSINSNQIVIEYGVTPTVGLQVNALCDHYVLGGNNLRRATTPLTNTPGFNGTSRIDGGNVIA